MTEIKYRMERIERLLYELRYEIERGMMEREVDELLEFSFYVPRSHSIPGGVVHCAFRCKPISSIFMEPGEPLLKVVK